MIILSDPVSGINGVFTAFLPDPSPSWGKIILTIPVYCFLSSMLHTQWKKRGEITGERERGITMRDKKTWSPIHYLPLCHGQVLIQDAGI